MAPSQLGNSYIHTLMKLTNFFNFLLNSNRLTNFTFESTSITLTHSLHQNIIPAPMISSVVFFSNCHPCLADPP